MTKPNIKPKYLYLTITTFFIAIIVFFSVIYPQSLDEFRFHQNSFKEVFHQIYITITWDAARFFNIVDIFMLRWPLLWKIIFTIINPFIQLFIIFGVFFVATGRKINFKTKQDFYPFLMLILMYLLLIPNPSNTLFLIGGALNYSWAFVPPLILLCLFRKTIDKKEIKTFPLINILMFFIGFTSGMSNENTGPMMLGLCVLFLIYSKYKKIKIPTFYYYALAGIIIGIFAMFSLGAGLKRVSAHMFDSWRISSIFTKLFIFLGYFQIFIEATLYLPIINLFAILLLIYDKKTEIITDKNFLLSCLSFVCACTLFFVLFLAPTTSLRTYYSSTIFFFISFTMLLFIIKNIYKINLFKYLAIILFIILVIFAPLITIPHIHLYNTASLRQTAIKQAFKQNKKEVYVNRAIVLKGPTNNWTIEYYDILFPSFDEKLEKDFGLKIKYEKANTLFLATEPI